jgi:polyisoprenoid-binding protein YceI
MKIFKTLFLAITILISTHTVVAQKVRKIDTQKSKIEWTGKKLTSSHHGTIDFSKGSLTFVNNKLVGGNFVVDMNTINTTDISGKSKERLDGHLKADDFFGVKNHPESTLEFKTIETTDNPEIYKVTADLTIKGITHPATFDLKLNKIGASTKVIVNRILYDIKYASTGIGALADKAISDDFELNVALVY